MNNAITLFRIRGIEIRMHFTFPLILLWGAFYFGVFTGQGWEGAAFGVIVTLILFAIVVLHELGHALTARGFDIPVKRIVLLPIGGVSQMENIPEKPSQELAISIAGPAVNLVLAILLVLAGRNLLPNNLPNTSALMSNIGRLTFESIFLYVFATNIFIGAFNLLPAFPMDGGRVLRALLATRLEYTRATDIAVVVGQIAAWGLGLWGFMSGNLLLILIAIFIYMGAGMEGRMVHLRSVLRNLRAEDAYSRNVSTLSPDQTLQDAADLTLHSSQANFPVCEDGEVVGLLTLQTMVQALKKRPVDTPIDQIMLTEVPLISPSDELFQVQQKLSKNSYDALPVSKDGKFLGIITSRDISEIYQLATSSPTLFSKRLEAGRSA
ncbi:MAG: site-2 protease family protein [Anaerolineales bacterium]